MQVKDGKNRLSVKFEREPNGHWEQFGAHTETLIFTYNYVESLINRELGIEP